MTHKQVKFGKAKRSLKVKPVEDDYEGDSASWRAVLLSSDDVARMAEESTRARLINHLVSKSDNQYGTREFASYYCGSSRHVEPPCSITSHTNRVYIPPALQVIPTYQSLIQTPQWCPYIRQTEEQNSQSDLAMNRKYNCRCVECLSADCPSRSNCRFRPRRMKDNIMTFCDQYTMTRILNDASCGCTPTSSTLNCTTVSVPCETSMSGGRDQGRLKIHEMSNKLGTYTPIPILKKGHIVDPVNNDYRTKKFQDGHNDVEPPKTMSIECFFRKKDDGTGCESSRKNIYNEGISDVALKYPSSPKKGSRSPATPMRARSRVTLSSECSDSEDNIPYSHRSESRYHRHCAEMLPRQFLDNGIGSRAASGQRMLVFSPKISPCKTCSSKRSKQQQRNIKLPKKVLTSEKLADACSRKPKAHKTPSTRQ